jgi:hypothetical protein
MMCQASFTDDLMSCVELHIPFRSKFVNKIRVMLNSAPGALVKHTKIEIKHKLNVVYTFNVLNARVLRQNFLIYVFN